ncbi:MAG: proteasome subunit alpha, partial [Mumia sp.]|nr:proteasome subunit alpha [Mumia sp.]
KDHYTEGLALEAAITLAAKALGHDDTTPRVLTADQLEVAVLDRTRTRPRKFKRLTDAQVDAALASA